MKLKLIIFIFTFLSLNCSEYNSEIDEPGNTSGYDSDSEYDLYVYGKLILKNKQCFIQDNENNLYRVSIPKRLKIGLETRFYLKKINTEIYKIVNYDRNRSGCFQYCS